MGERQVSIAGRTFPVPSPFLVLATQNPIESEGVYQLPEAQRDRFLLKIDVEYPTEAQELAIVYRMGTRPPTANPILGTAEVEALREAAADVFVHDEVARYAVRLVAATRDPAATASRSSPGCWPTGRGRARRSGWSRPGARWRCCAGGSTCCRATCGTWPGT